MDQILLENRFDFTLPGTDKQPHTLNERGLCTRSRRPRHHRIKYYRGRSTLGRFGYAYLRDTQLPTPETMGEAFERLREIHVLTPEVSEKMKKAVDFRNIAVHNYDEINININITYTIAKEHTQDFIKYIKQIYSLLIENRLRIKR